MAGATGIEPVSAVLETVILPLYYAPMVTCTGFEPVNAAVKGRCVKPLHQQATVLLYNTLNNLALQELFFKLFID